MPDSRTLPDPPNKPGKSNWVEKSGGLPDFIKRIAKQVHAANPGWPWSRAIATAASQAEKVCATGMTFGGRTKVSAAARARYCAAIAAWKAKAKGAKVTEAFGEMPRVLMMRDLTALAEDAEARLRALEGSIGLAGLHLLAGLELKEESEADLRALREEALDCAAIIEAVDLPRHRDGKWTNILKRVTAVERTGEDVMSDVRGSREAPAA